MTIEQVRRSPHLFFYLQDGQTLDVLGLLRGAVQMSRAARVWVISLLAGEEFPLSREDLELLFEIPSEEWIRADELRAGADLLQRFARQGVVISDDRREPFATFRRRHEGAYNGPDHLSLL